MAAAPRFQIGSTGRFKDASGRCHTAVVAVQRRTLNEEAFWACSVTCFGRGLVISTIACYGETPVASGTAGALPAPGSARFPAGRVSARATLIAITVDPFTVPA